MHKKFKFKKLIMIAVIIIALIAVWYFFFKEKEQVAYVTEPVVRADISRVVNATGEVGPVQLVSVGAQVTGKIEKLYVVVGQTIKKGDLIAQIDSTTQENDLASNKAKLDSYQSQLEAAQVALKIAKTQYDRETKLYAGQATSKENLENAENSYAAALSKVTELESSIVQTRIAVNTSEINLGYTRIEATMDGIIVSVPVEEGQTVNANQTTPTIVQIADLGQMEILMEIAEGDVTKVAPGMRVTYSVLSEPQEIYETELASIDPGLTTLTKGTYVKGGNTDAAIYYYGRLIVENSDSKLHIGMTTQNVIVIAEAKDVLTVPSLAIYRQNGNQYVHVLERGVVLEKVVETGLTDNMTTEIKSGLKENEMVITSSMTASQINDSRANTPMRGGPRM